MFALVFFFLILSKEIVCSIIIVSYCTCLVFKCVRMQLFSQRIKTKLKLYTIFE